MWWPFRLRRRADARVRALRRFVTQRTPRADHAHELLDAWGFDAPIPMTVFLVRPASYRRHPLLIEQEWSIVLEDGETLPDYKIERIVGVITELAERLGVSLNP